MSIPTLLSHWRAEPSISANIAEWRNFPIRAARFTTFPDGLQPTLVKALHIRGVRQLYIHQRQACENVRAGHNPVIVTGTASGKTLAYNLPVLDCLLSQSEARALYLFPTKALAQDQLSGLRSLLEAIEWSTIHGFEGVNSGYAQEIPINIPPFPITLAIYDGDTSSNARPTIRAKARLILSNPDMLHAGILPHHTNWAHFFQHLQFVVIDELHTYRGVFGSHVANVIRRLKRVARFYGSHPQFILTSATISNPLELAERLIEEPVVLVDDDGSARGPRHFLIYNPPVVNRDLGIRRSALLESVRLVEDLLHYNVQTIVFGRARRTVELILTYLRSNPSLLDGQVSHDENQKDHAIRGYRSGYLPRQRREIEQGLRRGEVRTVVATNALELGIDIGGMGAAILAGYPGTIAATWQQAGRAGRGTSESLTLMVATASPIDQYLAHHPDYFFGRSPEQALINPDNLLILLAHLRCAVFELPFQVGETYGRVPTNQVVEFLEFLRESGVLHQSGEKYFWMADEYPAESVSLRSASAERFLLQEMENETWTTIGEIDAESAPWMVHPHAVYMHEAKTYLVEELDTERNIARLRCIEVDYYTQPKTITSINLIEKYEESKVQGATKAHGEILVTTQVTGYRKIKWFTHEQLDQGDLSLPPTELVTTGYWLALSEDTVNSLRERGLWNNDPNDYGPNWSVQRDRVRTRDGYRCQVCGSLEQGRAHDVHHKIPFRTFASYEQANQLHNLITLCPSCHRTAEAAVRMRSGLAGLAYGLGNLAPLFLMCDDRDLGLHSDPSSTLAEGNPVVVLYDRVPAGIGFSQRLYELHEEMVTSAHNLVDTCECTDGCPSCVGPAGESGVGGKRETLELLEKLINLGVKL